VTALAILLALFGLCLMLFGGRIWNASLAASVGTAAGLGAYYVLRQGAPGEQRIYIDRSCSIYLVDRYR